MKIEVLYVPDCPHHPAAILKLKEVLAAEGIAVDILEVVEIDCIACGKSAFPEFLVAANLRTA